ncbi:MAG TPA: MarR family transcriptional regulator [Paludibacteraceae bacterium]|nr:MarR family transcriptional regulator [Paludibacteraceae bacterium]HPT42709.1 MarR family transcriptional regulator [Paludibacteraceae bacterium]
MAYEQLKLENQLCFPFYAVSRLITRAYQDDLDALGITYPQYLVMMVMWEFEELSVIEIADKLVLNTNTVTPLLKRMETMELINRIPSETDHRKVMVKLTEKGKIMQEAAAIIPMKLVQKLKIDPNKTNIEEINKLKSQLNALIELLKSVE